MEHSSEQAVREYFMPEVRHVDLSPKFQHGHMNLLEALMQDVNEEVDGGVLGLDQVALDQMQNMAKLFDLMND